MDKIILLVVCMAAGLAIRRFRILPPDSYKVLNELLIHFFMPALILVQITQLAFDRRFLFPILVAWIIFSLAIVFFIAVGKWLKVPPKSTAALIITGGISSTSFLGFPIFEMLYGSEGLQVAILMSQAGSFLIGITLGVAVASWYASATPSMTEISKNVIRFPPFIAFLVAVLLNISDIHFPVVINELLLRLSGPFTVLALLSVGMQINLSPSVRSGKLLRIGLLLSLIHI